MGTNEKKKVPCPFCRDKDDEARKKCEKCEGKGWFHFEMAPTERSGYLEMWINQVLKVIEDVVGISNAFTTDESQIGDFLEGEEDGNEERLLKEMSEQLGFKVEWGDLIVDVAQKLKDL
jgi:RecJ-like exonuclease